MTKEKKLIKFITELIKATKNSEIKWKEVDSPNALIKGTSNIVPICFETKFKEKNFILYEQRFKHFFDEEFFEWGREIKIACTTYESKVIWENNEAIPNLYDLFLIVQEKVSGIDDFLDTFL